LAAGHDRELVGALGPLVERFPLRERLRGRLIRALAGAGRTADALAEFRRTRDVLSEELGVEPGRELQDLHRQVLNTAPKPPVRGLPRMVGDFTGRDDAVRRLLRTIDEAGPGSPVVAVIDGMAGCGKTTLALHVAALVGDRYPDAHLFADLHGYSDREPVEPAAALLTLLRQLGVPATAVPAEPAERVTMWRTELSRRRVLVVLDNAYSSAQLADLLPTSAGALALVTSRRRLVGLDGAHPESLPLLTEPDALALLARIAGERVGAEPAASAEVVRRCGGLPLALRLAGARLAHRPQWRVADLVRRLGESTLPELAIEDRSVSDAFALSYGQLAGPARRMFRLLGVHPAALFDAPVAAALAGLPLEDARDLLDDLIDVHLLDEPEHGIFRLHDLLREFAATLAADLPPAERRTAVEAVLDLQTHIFVASTLPARRALLDLDLGRPRPRRPDLVAAVADPVARLEWERPQLGGYVDAAAGTTYAWWIPRAAWWYLFSRGYYDDLRALFERSLALVERAGDRAGLAVVANYLASAYVRIADFPRALSMIDRALTVQEELGNHRAVATALGNRAGLYTALGRQAECIASGRAALRLRALSGDISPARATLQNLGAGYGKLGRHAEALYYRRLAFFAAIEAGDAVGVAIALNHIQKQRRALGQTSPRMAARYLDLALRLTRRHGHRAAEAEVLDEQGILLRELGRFEEATAAHEAAIAIMAEASDRLYVATFSYDLAVTRALAGDQAGARTLYRRALRDARELGAMDLVALAQRGADQLRPAAGRGTMVG